MALPKLLQKLFTNEGAGDKLNQDIIPDIPYSKVTGAPVVDSALSSTSENPVQNKVINSALDGKLSTSGGIMAGNIAFNASAYAIIKTDTNGSLAISGGNNISSGGAGSAILWLGGGDDSSAFNSPGMFSLEASKGTWGQSGFSSYALRGTPSGALTWDGHNVISVVAEYYSYNSWYRKYSDGWIEQGGWFEFSKAGTMTTTFLHAFSNANYSVVFSTNNDHNSWLVTLNPTYFGIDSTSNISAKAFWYACGK